MSFDFAAGVWVGAGCVILLWYTSGWHARRAGRRTYDDTISRHEIDRAEQRARVDLIASKKEPAK